MRTLNTEISEIIHKSILGECSEKEDEILAAWLEDDKNKALYKRISEKSAYDAVGRFEFDADKERKEFLRFVKGKSLAEKSLRRKFIIKKYSVAASLVVILTSTLFLFVSRDNLGDSNIAGSIDNTAKVPTLHTSSGEVIKLTKNCLADSLVMDNGVGLRLNEGKLEYGESLNSPKKVQKTAYSTIKVPRGANYIFRMQDGTTVHLNSNTVFRYPVPFEKGKREVSIEGEGFFAVTKDANRPFIVVTKNSRTTVLGTQFNVNTEDGNTETTLIEGSVKVNNNCKDSTVLIPGEQARVSADKIEKMNVDTGLITAWKDGYFAYEDVCLDKILKDLSDWYGFEYFYQNSELKDITLTARVRRFDNVSGVLEIIEKIGGVKFRIKGDSVIVEKAN